jgi:hypothetical protein
MRMLEERKAKMERRRGERKKGNHVSILSNLAILIEF